MKPALDKLVKENADDSEKPSLNAQIAHTVSLHEFADLDVAKLKYANIGVNSLEYDGWRNKAIVETADEIKQRFDTTTGTLKTQDQIVRETIIKETIKEKEEAEKGSNTWAMINTFIASISLLSVGALVMSNRKLQSKIHDLEGEVDDLNENNTDGSFAGDYDNENDNEEYEYDGNDMA
jgi:hypothetical protein